MGASAPRKFDDRLYRLAWKPAAPEIRTAVNHSWPGCGRNSIAKCTPSSSRPGTGRSRGCLGAAGQQHGVELGLQLLGAHVALASLVTLLPLGRARPPAHPSERHALGLHLLDAAVDVRLLHLEVGDAVAQQAADAVVLLEHRHRVAGARQLLRRGQARRAGADHRHLLAGLAPRRLRHAPSPRPSRGR